MANATKTYYFPPNWDILPGGPLSLGSVLASVKRPIPPLVIRPVVDTATPTIPGTVSTNAVPLQIFASTKRNFSYTASTSFSVSPGLFALFLSSVLGIGVTASTTLERDRELKMLFSRLDTQEWYPSTDELQVLVNQEPVARYLSRLKAWSPKQVFVVTGIKLAYGARAETNIGHNVEGNQELSLDPGLAGGVPGVVTFGPKIDLGTKTETEVGWETGAEGEEDKGFLFAYKVQLVKVKKTKNGNVITDHVEKTSGAVFGEEAPVVAAPDVYEVETEDAETDMEGILAKADDGSESVWIVPS